MGIERLISLESGSLLEVDAYGGSVSISTTEKRTGARSLLIDSISTPMSYYAVIKAPGRSEYYIQVCFFVGFANTHTDADLLRLTDAAGNIVATVRIPQNTTMLKAYLGNSAVYVGDIGLYQTNVWNVLQIRLKLHDTDGVYQVKLGQDMTVDYSGDTIVGSGTSIARLVLGHITYNATGRYTYYDDIIIHNTLGSRNNSWPNGARLYRLVPNGAGTYTQWTPSAGSNWDCLEEVPPSLSDYIRPTEADQTDTYQLTNLPPEIHQVSGLAVEYWGETVGSPVINAIKPVIRLGSTDYVGDAFALSPVFSPKQVAYDQAPNGQAWTVAMVNDMEVGQRSASA